MRQIHQRVVPRTAPDDPDRPLERRRFLHLAGSIATVGLAGCTEGLDIGASPPKQTSTPTETRTEPATSTPTATPTPTPTGPTPAVGVHSQETDGTRIVVRSARIDRPGWLIVHPSAEGGGPNPEVALGRTRLRPGSYRNLTVELNESIERSGQLFAVLHYDDPADGEFTFPWTGDPAVTTDGHLVAQRFAVTVTARVRPSLRVTDHKSDGKHVTVSRAAIDKPGWVAVHPPAEDGGPNLEAVWGRRRLRPGAQTAVTVELDESFRRTQRLFAALHYDEPGRTGVPTARSIVTTDGKPVISSFSVTVERPTEIVRMTGTFEPRGVSVEPGTSILWVNDDLVTHTVTADTEDHKWNINTPYHRIDEKLAPDEATRYTFWEPGVYEFYCRLHGRTSECGVVIVGDASLDEELPCELGLGHA